MRKAIPVLAHLSRNCLLYRIYYYQVKRRTASHVYGEIQQAVTGAQRMFIKWHCAVCCQNTMLVNVNVAFLRVTTYKMFYRNIYQGMTLHSTYERAEITIILRYYFRLREIYSDTEYDKIYKMQYTTLLSVHVPLYFNNMQLLCFIITCPTWFGKFRTSSGGYFSPKSSHWLLDGSGSHIRMSRTCAVSGTGHPLQNAHFQTKKPLKGGPMLRKERQEGKKIEYMTL
jgi:hypothetical protein